MSKRNKFNDSYIILYVSCMSNCQMLGIICNLKCFFSFLFLGKSKKFGQIVLEEARRHIATAGPDKDARPNPFKCRLALI